MSEAAASTKSWWERPEKWMNFVGLGLLGVGVFLGLDKIMPVVNRVMELVFSSTLYALGTAALVIVTTWIITNKELHKLAWYGYEMVMRKLTGLLIEIDPIAIMHTFVKDLKRNKKELEGSLASLEGQARKLEDKIRRSIKEYEHSMQMASQAKKHLDKSGMRGQMQMYSRKAGRRQESQVTYQGLLNRLKKHIALTKKINEVSGLMIMDIEDTIEVETEKRQTIRASHKAMSASKRILAANEKREMYDRAMESVTNDYYQKLGEIEQFMEDSQHFVTTMDLENGIYEEEALAKLEAWDKRSETLLAGGSGNTKFRVEQEDMGDLDLSHEAEPPEFAELFRTLDT